MKRYITLILSVVFLSCQNKEKENKEARKPENTKKESKFEMYQMSEMAALMEQMYVDNQRLKEKIINGETIGKFPDHFLKIHHAAMTDSEDNDTYFKEQAEKFITTQEFIYKDPKNAKKHFNDGIDTCIQCHQEKCGGPIPRIKKLYIK